MVTILPKLRRPDRAEIAGRIRLPNLPDRAGLADRIKLPGLPDRAQMAQRLKLPNLPDRAEIAGRIKLPDLPEMPTLPEMPDLSGLPKRLRRSTRRTARAPGSWPRTWVAILAVALSGIAGAVAAYFLDPDRGKARRTQTIDRIAGAGRRARRRVGRLARYTSSTAASMGERLSRHTTDYEPPNDAALAAKIESELFRDPEIPKGRMNVNVENGIAILRGVADSPEQIKRIVTATRAIAGVRSVRSLLRPAAEPEPVSEPQPAAGPQPAGKPPTGKPPAGEMASPNGSADEFLPASPGR